MGKINAQQATDSFSFNFMLVHKTFPKHLHTWYKKADTTNRICLEVINSSLMTVICKN